MPAFLIINKNNNKNKNDSKRENEEMNMKASKKCSSAFRCFSLGCSRFFYELFTAFTTEKHENKMDFYKKKPNLISYLVELRSDGASSSFAVWKIYILFHVRGDDSLFTPLLLALMCDVMDIFKVLTVFSRVMIIIIACSVMMSSKITSNSCYQQITREALFTHN